MKNQNKTDKSTPYRTLGIGPVKAPAKPAAQPKATVTAGKNDLRGGKK